MMKAVVLAVAMAVAAYAFTKQEVRMYEAFKVQYASRAHKALVGEDRLAVFVENVHKAKELHMANPEAVFGVTKFSDLTEEEFDHYYLNADEDVMPVLPAYKLRITNAPDVDWRGKAVASVKDQGSCGSCWAFSSAAALEACIMLKNGGTPVDISPQRIVDCCRTAGDGCNGGTTKDAVMWTASNDQASFTDYPYKAVQQTCHYNASMTIYKAGDCVGKSITPLSETNLQNGIQDGPVSISIAGTPLQSYISGIISGNTCKTTAVNHAVLLAAWIEGNYVVKNSWGADWGEEGFFRMKGGVNCLGIITRQNTIVLPAQ